MKSIVISALLASSKAIRFIPHDDVPTDNVNLQTENQIRTEIQTSLRSYLESKAPYEWTIGYLSNKYPETILPGSVAILPKASAPIEDISYWPSQNEMSYARKDTVDDIYLQIEDRVMEAAEERATIRATLQNQLRNYLENKAPYEWSIGYLSNKWPETILPGSTAILPKASAPIEDISYWPSQNEMSYHRKDTVDDIYLQTEDVDEISVEDARLQAAQMQAQMDRAVADADAKRAEQQAQYEKNIVNDDPQAQLQGLMNAQQSLHRLTSAFSSKPNMDKVTQMAQKLGIPMTPELMQLGNNEAISNALVEIAVGMGKSEQEIGMALD